MLFSRLIPDYMFSRYDEVTPEFLRSIGVRVLLADIDNTLAPYEQPDPDDRHRAWLASLAQAGISVALVSNNGRARVERFNETLGLTAYWDCGKPSRKFLDRAMAELSGSVADTAVLGDQLLTDAYAGKRLGLVTIIVPPIRDKKTLFFRFKRLLERPFLRAYRRREARRRVSEEK